MKNVMRSLLLGTIVAIMLCATALTASAHVSINPSTAEEGGYGTFSFKVPNETEDATTTKVVVQFPTDDPIASVSVQPKPGWTYSVAKEKINKPEKDDDGNTVDEAVSTITWEGGTIKPGEFDQFTVSMGPLPETDSLTFKALQTYDNGDVVSWIEESVEGAAEPEHPAMVLSLTKPTSDSSHHATVTKKSAVTVTKTDDTTKTLAYVGIGVAGLALLLAIIAVFKKKK